MICAQDTSLNALTNVDVNRIWLPFIVYANTDQKVSFDFCHGQLFVFVILLIIIIVIIMVLFIVYANTDQKVFC